MMGCWGLFERSREENNEGERRGRPGRDPFLGFFSSFFGCSGFTSSSIADFLVPYFVTPSLGGSGIGPETEKGV